MIRQIHLRALHRSTINVPGISSRKYPTKKQVPIANPNTLSSNPCKSLCIVSFTNPTFARST